MSSLKQIKETLLTHVTVPPEQVKRFFKTGVSSYGEGDEFIGVTVPALRKIAKTFFDTNLNVLQELLSSKVNEERLLALLILVDQYQRAENVLKEEIYQFYLNNLKGVNNWNLVDSSAHLIVGAHLWDKDCSILVQLASSDNLWERRIAIVSTWYFIRKQEVTPTFEIAELLLQDKHDLIHKAVGWMLREAGKRNTPLLIDFLQLYSAKMPRTMLRYAIEKLESQQRAYFLATKRSVNFGCE